MFLDDEDRHHYRRLLREACLRHDVAVHAFVLMDNHVHLLLRAEIVGRISLALRLAGLAYVQAFNHRHGRTGTLWQGRFKSSLVDTEGYLLRVIRYIELNPVKAAMVERTEDYRWSSVHTHLDTANDPLLTPHPTYLAMGDDLPQRAAAYRTWLRAPLDNDELVRIRVYMRQEKALGAPRFQEMVSKALNRPIEVRANGRPRQNPFGEIS